MKTPRLPPSFSKFFEEKGDVSKMLEFVMRGGPDEEQYRGWDTFQHLTPPPPEGLTKDWINQIDRFLSFNEQQILRNAGSISHDMAVARAGEKYEKYRLQQNQEYISDFDRTFTKYLQGRE